MGKYIVSVVDKDGQHLSGFRAVLVHADAPNGIADEVKMDPPGPYEVAADGSAYQGSGTLYVIGPAEPGNLENFSHRENVKMSGGGEITFVLRKCSSNGVTAALTSEDLPNSKLFDPKSLNPNDTVTLELENNKTSVPKTVDLVCVPISLRVVDDGQKPKHLGFVFRFHFAGTLDYIAGPIHVPAGKSPNLDTSLPSGSGTLHCYYWNADANGEATGDHKLTRVHLRRYGHPMGADIVIVPDREPAQLEPGVHKGFFTAPQTVEYKHYAGGGGNDIPANFVVHNENDKNAASIAYSIWSGSEEDGKRQVLERYPQAKNIRILALSNGSFPYYVMADKGGSPGYHWLTYHWTPDEGRGAQFVEHGLKADKVFMEWEI